MATWMGLVPRQCSSGGKQLLLGTSANRANLSPASHRELVALLRTRSANSIRDRSESFTKSPDVWQQSLPSQNH